MKKKMIGILLGTAILGASAAAVTFGGTSLFHHMTTAAETAPAAVQPAMAKYASASLSYAETADAASEGTDTAVSTSDLITKDTDASETPDFSYANVADVAEACMPSIVAITNKSVQEINSFFYGRSWQYESESAGSGIIVGSNDTELLICTNNHVVENASELSVTFIDEKSYPAYLKGSDPDNDLAVVSVNLGDISEDTMAEIRIAKTGDSEEMRVGEQVVAIGNALGYGQSVTTGIISAKDRTITAGSGSYSYANATVYENLIQTDAAINFGNSGGALLNMNGEVIGINSAKVSSASAEGMGYAIPISKAMPILEDLMSRKTRIKLDENESGYMGIQGQSVSREATLMYGIPQGIYVTYAAEGEPAYDAGIREGDIITAFDGEAVAGMRDLQHLLQYYAGGETVEVTICSADDNYNMKAVSVTLGDRSAIQS